MNEKGTLKRGRSKSLRHLDKRGMDLVRQKYSKYAAVNLAKHKIRVNTISPGPFPSPAIIKKNKNFIKNLQAKNPLNTIGKPKDLITSILFLCSNNSNFITGINIPVDGGWKIW